MEKSIITFSANEQNLQKTGGIGCYASDTVSYIEAHFDLGENWSGYDSIRAVWFNDYQTISTVLDPNGVCVVPHEVLVNRDKVKVNLVGSILDGETLSDRLTTFPCEALKVSAKAKISGSETADITPSQFEQFVSIVQDAVANIKDIVSTTLNADYTLTFVYSDGTSYTTPSIRGERGPQGADGADGVTPNLSIGNVETLDPSEDAYVTRRGTDANPIFDFGIPKGDDGTVPDLDLILPTDTASGSIASITDGQNIVPVKSLKVTLEPIQSGSGDPSPSNPRPISGHTECVTEVCGVNVWDEEWEVGGYSSSTGLPIESSVIRSKNAILVIPNTGYYFRSAFAQTDVFRIYWYDGADNFISVNNSSTDTNKVINSPANARYMRFNCSGAYGTTYKNDISINYPSTDHEYHAYEGDTYATTLGRTVYGGTLDVVSGELVVDRAMVDLGTLNWASYGTGLFYANLVGAKPSEYARPSNALCSTYEVIAMAETSTKVGVAINNGQSRANVHDPTYTDATDFKTAMNGVQLCYELATPQTYQLDAQTISLLHGNNNVWSDGEVELTYNADVQLWVLKQLGTSGTRTLSMTRTLAMSDDADDTKTDISDTKSDVELTKSVQLAED